MDYSQILPQLFVGSCPEDIDDLDQLRREAGVTAVLNLQTDEDMRPIGLDREALEDHYWTCGIEFRRVPVRDFDTADLRNKLPECVRVLSELLAVSHRVYLHCTAGAGRSPTVAIAYLVWCDGWDLDDALAHVKQCRECSPNVEAIRLASWEHPGEQTTP